MPAIAPATARMYVLAVAALLRSSSARAAEELTQRHLARHLRRSPGRRTNLLRFLSWTTMCSGWGFRPGGSRRTPPRKRERATLRRAAFLLKRFGSPRNARERRAILAAAIAVAHGLPLKQVLALGNVHGGAGIALAEPFAPALRSLGGRRVPLRFGVGTDSSR